MVKKNKKGKPEVGSKPRTGSTNGPPEIELIRKKSKRQEVIRYNRLKN